MTIEFVLNDIKDLGLIYSKTEVYDEQWGENVVEETYVGTDYCTKIAEQLKSLVPEVQEVAPLTHAERAAQERYIIKSNSSEYSLDMTIDTFDEKKQTQISIKITSVDCVNEYDFVLERIKIALKEVLLKDWAVCTWIVDEQSEYLGMCLYPCIFKVENKMRWFINQVLTHNFGVNWIELPGFEDIIKSIKKNSAAFKREVPDFNNINTTLISTTAETLMGLMLNTKIYEPVFALSDTETRRLHGKIADNNPNSVFEFIKSSRKAKVDVWLDIFKKYFGEEDVSRAITDFIKNRNHVAHNKLLTKSSFEKMKSENEKLKSIFDCAAEQFLREDPSDELYSTWVAEQEEAQNQLEYIWQRIKDETGIVVRGNKEIINLFSELTHKLHTVIDDDAYFDYAVEISDEIKLNETPEPQIIFSVKSNANENFSFNICASVDSNEGMDEDSYLNLWIVKSDGSKELETTVLYHNGSAHEDFMECYYVPDSESCIEMESFNAFVEDLKSYIKYDMNPIKNELDDLSHQAAMDGGPSPVADFPCWNCYQNYISLTEAVYPYGKCANCGEDNDIKVCARCAEIYPADEGNEHLCGRCLDIIESE